METQISLTRHSLPLSRATGVREVQVKISRDRNNIYAFQDAFEKETMFLAVSTDSPPLLNTSVLDGPHLAERPVLARGLVLERRP